MKVQLTTNTTPNRHAKRPADFYCCEAASGKTQNSVSACSASYYRATINNCMNKRAERFFEYWYHPDAHMTDEDWIYCAILTAAMPVGFWVGMAIGWIITKTL